MLYTATIPPILCGRRISRVSATPSKLGARLPHRSSTAFSVNPVGSEDAQEACCLLVGHGTGSTPRHRSSVSMTIGGKQPQLTLGSDSPRRNIGSHILVWLSIRLSATAPSSCHTAGISGSVLASHFFSFVRRKAVCVSYVRHKVSCVSLTPPYETQKSVAFRLDSREHSSQHPSEAFDSARPLHEVRSRGSLPTGLPPELATEHQRALDVAGWMCPDMRRWIG